MERPTKEEVEEYFNRPRRYDAEVRIGRGPRKAIPNQPLQISEETRNALREAFDDQKHDRKEGLD